MDWHDYKSPTELETAAEQYFARCDETAELYGEAGLALALDLPLETLRSWYDGSDRPEMQAVVQRAYLRIQCQIESGDAYRDKNMFNRAVFLLKQRRLGGYQDRADAKSDAKGDTRIHVTFGPHTEPSDFL